MPLVTLATLLLVTVAPAAADAPAADAPAAARRPNVLIFLADDQGWGDLGVHGNRNLRTPAIDSLARDGVRLEHFIVCTVCAPTRAEFLTGRYHPRGGVRGVSTGQERLNLDERTIAESFRAAGYATGAFGKWHNGSQWPYHPRARGFEEYFGFTSGHWGEYFHAPLEHDGRQVRGAGYIADDFTDQALAFIERQRDRPWFCYLPFNTPHSPFCVPASYWEACRERPIEQRGSAGDQESLETTRAVLAMCENLDANVARVLRRLTELQLAEQTIVVYFSDNGPNTDRWNGGLKGRKGTLDEGGVRAPCLLRWPGQLPAGRVVREVCGAIDLLPTLTALAGIPRLGDRPLDGLDLSPLLRGPLADWPQRTIFSHYGGRISARTDQYRLDARGGLFDLTTDPGQLHNLASERPAVVERLQREVEQWRKDVLADTPARDDRPFPVGYADWPQTWLPARDGVPRGQVRRSAPAPNSSYFVNWTSVEDRLTWDIEVATAGRYDVTLLYTCPASDVGATVELACGASRLTGAVEPAWDPPLIRDQDVIPRPPAESIMKEFRPLRLGTVELQAGRHPLILRALTIPGQTVMDLRAVSLTLLADRAPGMSP